MGLLVEGADASHVREPSGDTPIQVVSIPGVEFELDFFTFQVDAGTLRWRVMRVNKQSFEVSTVTSGTVSDAVWTGILQAVPVRAGIVALHDGNDRVETWRWNGSSVQRLTYDFVPTERSAASGIGAYGTDGRLLRIWPSGTWGGKRTGIGYGWKQWGRAYAVGSDGSLSAITGEQNFWVAPGEFKGDGFDIHKGVSLHRNGYGLAYGRRWWDPSGQDSSENRPGGYSFHWDEANDIFTYTSSDETGETLAGTGSGGERSNETHMRGSGSSSYVRQTFDNVYGDGTTVRFHDHDDNGTFVSWGLPGAIGGNLYDPFDMDACNVSGANDDDYWVGAFASFTSSGIAGGDCKVGAIAITDRTLYDESDIVINARLPNDPASQGSTDAYPVGAGQVGAYYVITWANASTRYWRTYYDISKLSVPYLRMNRRADASRSSGRHDPSVQDSIRNPGGGVFV